ncbi:MAG: glycine radical domain-containing protein [Thermodesulfobacteriota bacterium]
MNNFFLRVPIQDQIIFSRHLAIMTKAGMSLVDSLAMLKNQANSKSMKTILTKVIADVSNGEFLSTALEHFRGVFGDLFINVIKVGEASCILSENLTYLSSYLKKKHELRRKITGALPHGRRRGEAFASGIAPVNGMDRKGPTALLNSVNSIDFTQIANGVNLNLQFDRALLNGEKGASLLDALLKTYFERGGMQVQVNAFDPQILVEARNDPHKYPHLLVRVSGYSAYFNDLAPAMKEEIISRTVIASVR